MATNLLNFKQRSPRVLLTPLRLPSVSTPGVSCKNLYTTTKVTTSTLHFSSLNSKSPSISNSVRTAKSFLLSNHIINRFSCRSVKALKWKMEKLHSKYVFAPADKAANNVIIIWKRYYVAVLKEELNSTSTYIPAQLTKDNLLLRHIDTLTKSNIKIDKLELPTFYWLPKLHKNPYKSRFISNSSHCSTTILS